MRLARQSLASAFTLLALAALPGHAQQLMGIITGSATDSSGSILQGASVKATDNGTGLVRSTQTGEDGKFRFLLLPVGNYRIEASHAGFKGFRRDGIVVEADRSLDVTIALEVGSVVEVVEVTAGTPLLEPNTSSLGSVIDKQKVDELPLNGRNPMGLANLIPTVRGIGFFGGQVLSSWRMAAVSIGGGSALHNDFMVDGIATTKVGSSGAQVYPTIESTQEFKILTNAMSAEFGRTAGGIVSVITRSGTNEYHGNLFEYLRNDKLNANEFFSNKAGRQRPSLRWNQFGGSLGGPIVRNRLFF
ncbi:MAG: carboxypeptidase-like regulatory domain-containing protein, partial [Acidobacteria bacterium]|nr:carboxypeptidase-like regulatory domain-containing protein [Acidobacteriota bacterium]